MLYCKRVPNPLSVSISYRKPSVPCSSHLKYSLSIFLFVLHLIAPATSIRPLCLPLCSKEPAESRPPLGPRVSYDPTTVQLASACRTFPVDSDKDLSAVGSDCASPKTVRKPTTTKSSQKTLITALLMPESTSNSAKMPQDSAPEIITTPVKRPTTLMCRSPKRREKSAQIESIKEGRNLLMLLKHIFT